MVGRGLRNIYPDQPVPATYKRQFPIMPYRDSTPSEAIRRKMSASIAFYGAVLNSLPLCRRQARRSQSNRQFVQLSREWKCRLVIAIIDAGSRVRANIKCLAGFKNKRKGVREILPDDFRTIDLYDRGAAFAKTRSLILEVNGHRVLPSR